MVIGCEAELYLHKTSGRDQASIRAHPLNLRAESIKTNLVARVRTLHLLGPLRPHLHGLGQGRPVRGVVVPSCWCCVAVGTSSRRAELLVLCGRQQANQPAPTHLGMDTGPVFFFRSSQSLFFFFSGTLAGTKFRQEDTIQGTKFRQEDTIQGTKSDKETCRSGSHSGCGPFVNSIGKRSGCLAQINQSPAQMNLKQQGARP